MEIVFHFGLHCTDDEALLRCLLKNAAPLRAEGIVVPGPARYRRVLREAINTLNGAAPSVELTETILDAILGEDPAERLVMSYENFLCGADRALGGGMLYPKADKVAWFARLFPGAATEAHLAIRNPATLLPALRARCDAAAFDAQLGGMDAAGLSWAGVIARMQAAAPDVAFTVWCDEDTPLIWPEVVRAVSGCAEGTPLAGLYDRLGEIMQPGGAGRLESYLLTHPPTNEEQRRRIVSAFLDKFVPPEALAVEPELPGWTEDDLAVLTEAYDADVAAIAAMPGVRFIAP